MTEVIGTTRKLDSRSKELRKQVVKMLTFSQRGHIGDTVHSSLPSCGHFQDNFFLGRPMSFSEVGLV